MQEFSEVVVLRLGHRPGRDDRMTTHVALTARVFGADRVVIQGNATSTIETVQDITERFGGSFRAELIDSYKPFLRGWSGLIAHLTMYGEPIQRVTEPIRSHAHVGTSLLIVVGAEKVPFDVYDNADWNVSVTNQPHSEVGSLAIFLDRLYNGNELDKAWEGGTHRVLPSEARKRVLLSESEPVE